jgi:hypothetical protein
MEQHKTDRDEEEIFGNGSNKNEGDCIIVVRSR